MISYPPVTPNPPKRPMIVPNDTKELRACLKCHLVRTRDQFIKEGCANCDFFSRDADVHDREAAVDNYTTAAFEGLIAIITPGKGWVTRWQGIPRLFHRFTLFFFFFASPHFFFFQCFNSQIPARQLRVDCEKQGFRRHFVNVSPRPPFSSGKHTFW